MLTATLQKLNFFQRFQLHIVFKYNRLHLNCLSKQKQSPFKVRWKIGKTFGIHMIISEVLKRSSLWAVLVDSDILCSHMTRKLFYHMCGIQEINWSELYFYFLHLKCVLLLLVYFFVFKKHVFWCTLKHKIEVAFGWLREWCQWVFSSSLNCWYNNDCYIHCTIKSFGFI